MGVWMCVCMCDREEMEAKRIKQGKEGSMVDGEIAL